MTSFFSMLFNALLYFFKQCFDFLAKIQIFSGVSLLQFIFGIIVVSVISTGLISVVRIGSVSSVSYEKRMEREREKRVNKEIRDFERKHRSK